MDPQTQVHIIALLYSALGIAVLIGLSMTLHQYPLTDWAVDNLEWTRSWLFTTVLDYYGAALCLCVIAIVNEPFVYGALWTLGFCLLGSPICCSYIVYRALSKSLVFTNKNRSGHTNEEV